MNAGKKDEALAFVDQTISDFNRQASDPQALQGYQYFAQTAIRSSGRRSRQNHYGSVDRAGWRIRLLQEVALVEQ